MVVQHLNLIDYIVIIGYLGILIGLGIYLKKKAAASLEDYFLGGRSLPWWALGISGMASFLDAAGTMLIVSFLFIMGPKGLYVEFRGGAVLALAIMMLWTGKWCRRSGCITGAEWMRFRFGDGPGGQFARTVSAFARLIGTIGMLGLLIKGSGIFLALFLPWEPWICALVLVILATLYTMLSGFYGVVFTDIFQSFIIVIAVIGITVLAMTKVTDVGSLSDLAENITGNSNWSSSRLQWKTETPAGYEAYSAIGMFVLFYIVKQLFHGSAGGDDPKFFGARNDRECGMLTLTWITTMMVRWPMIMGFAVLGIFLVADLFPNPEVLSQASELIQQHAGPVTKVQWDSTLASVMHHPEQYADALSGGLQGLLGENWQMKLHLVSYEGTANPEKILPAVILFNIPRGLRGMLIVALLAATMSTFDSYLNMATGFFTRDLYQRYIRPTAKNKELIFASYACGAAIVFFAFLFAYTVESINDIWGWLMMGLGAGLLIPRFIRFYWWRFNGGGFAIGMLAGVISAVIQRIFWPGLDERLQFLILATVGLTGAIVGTLMTAPTKPEILEKFYLQTRPFGFWGPLKKKLPLEAQKAINREHFYDIISLPFVGTWQVTLFLLPMQLVIKDYKSLAITLVIFLFSMIGMYFFWYRNLPKDNFHVPGLADETINA